LTVEVRHVALQREITITAQLAESSKEGLERKMRELLVKSLISLASSQPYLLSSCAFIGAFWLARSFIHKARLFTEHVLKEVRGGKAELREWLPVLRELGRELTTWKGER
jgi:hypothetical protein